MSSNYSQNTTYTPATAPTNATGGKSKKGLVALIIALVLVAIASISAAVYFGLSSGEKSDKDKKQEAASVLREDNEEEKDFGMKLEENEAEEQAEVKIDKKEVEEEAEVEVEEEEAEEQTETEAEETITEDEMKVNMTEEDEKKLKAVEAVEAKDTFGVKIVNKSIVKNMTGSSLSGADGLILELGNKSGKEVNKVEILAVGYIADQGWAPVEEGLHFRIHGKRGDEYINGFGTADGFSIPKDSSEQLVLNFNAEGYIAIKAIVSSYTTEDGTVHENPIVEEWVKAVAGMSDPSTIR
ncbi:MAG: hypothetical protein IJO61_05640 [Oscillospiraceae bacterium]|nr:hypothetical protein [Oscillospiraceae bacterium]